MTALTDKEIVEGDRAIAEFHHGGINDKGQKFLPDHICKDYFENTLQYHTSWDWLMPAWEKFRDLKLATTLRDEFNFHCTQIAFAITHYDVSVACSRLVRAIQWYNSKQTDSK